MTRDEFPIRIKHSLNLNHASIYWECKEARKPIVLFQPLLNQVGYGIHTLKGCES